MWFCRLFIKTRKRNWPKTDPWDKPVPRSHIHGSPRRFHYGSNLTDDPGNVIFRSSIRMHNGVATGFDVSTKDKIEKAPLGDMIDTVCYGLVRNATV